MFPFFLVIKAINLYRNTIIYIEKESENVFREIKMKK